VAAGRMAVLSDGAVSGVLGGLWEDISHLHKAMLLLMGLNFGKLEGCNTISWHGLSF
jgi:hypothetical protein